MLSKGDKIKRLIVGVDPGVYTAIVILDLRGKVIASRVSKEFGEEGAVSYIMQFGKPIIIATDVSIAPHFVEKLSAIFNAKLIKPPKDIPVSRKEEIELKDPHLRDAMAAALYAYRHYENVFRNIDSKLMDEDEKELMKENVVFGRKRKPTKIKKLNQKRKKERKRKKSTKIKKVFDIKEYISQLKEEIKNLREENARLKSYLKAYERLLIKKKKKTNT